MTSATYSYKFGLPALPLPNGVFRLNYTKHAMKRKNDRTLTNRELPPVLDTSKAKVIEVETRTDLFDEELYKVLYQVEVNNKNIALAVVFEGKTATVKTVWSEPAGKEIHGNIGESYYKKP